MKKIKLILLILLFIVTIFNFIEFSYGEITISSKGRGETMYNDDGTWQFHCDNSSDNNCSLIVKPAV